MKSVKAKETGNESAPDPVRYFKTVKMFVELFEKDEEPIGEYIRINDIYFQVVGVHKFVPGGGFESDGDIFIPFETYPISIF